MKISNFSMGKAGSCFTGIVFVSAIIGAGTACTETYRHGGSTTTIQQSGGSSKSESVVKRYKDGQMIITHDGNSTDITIQRDSGLSPSGDSREYTQTGDAYFYKRYIEGRFSRFDPND